MKRVLRSPAFWSLAAIAAIVVIIEARPYDDALFLQEQAGSGWAYHLDRASYADRWSQPIPELDRGWIVHGDHMYPPLLPTVMARLGTITGHGEEAVGRAMVLWLLLLAGAVGLCAFRVSGSALAGWVTGAATVATPALAAASLTYYYDLPMTALLWLSVALLLLLRSSTPELAGVLAGLCWFAAAIVKWTALPFGAVMLLGAFLVHLPDERWSRREALRRLRAALAASAVMGGLLHTWFAHSTASWQAMSFTTVGPRGAWSPGAAGTGGLAWLSSRIQPGGLERLVFYSSHLVTSVLSPLLAGLLLVLLWRWFRGARRGASLVACTCLGQLAVLLLLVPAAEPRFLLTLAPALVLPAGCLVAQLPRRQAVGVALCWFVIGSFVTWDVHHADSAAWNRSWRTHTRPGGGVLVGGRGLSIASADLGWRRSDEPLPIFPRDRATCGGRPPAAGRPRCSSSRASSPAPPTPPG